VRADTKTQRQTSGVTDERERSSTSSQTELQKSYFKGDVCLGTKVFHSDQVQTTKHNCGLIIYKYLEKKLCHKNGLNVECEMFKNVVEDNARVTFKLVNDLSANLIVSPKKVF